MASLLAGVTLLKFQPYWTFVFFFFYSDDILTKIGCIKKWWKGCKNMAFGRTQTLCNTHFGNLRMTLRIYFWRIDFYIIWNLTSSPSSKWGKFTIFHFIEMFETDGSKRRSRDMMESVFPQSNTHPGSKGRPRPQTMKTAKTNTLFYHWDQKERSRISSQSLKMNMLLFCWGKTNYFVICRFRINWFVCFGQSKISP